MYKRFLACCCLLWIFSAEGSVANQVISNPPEVLIVPFSHLDLFWGGTEEECLSRSNRIITRAIQLAQQYPEFRFLLEDNIFVANFVESQRGTPELEALMKLVKEGRIEIAPKWVGIYQNLPRGEALVRNLVYGKRYARDLFGVDPQVAHLGDIPGYTWQYPQLLAKSAIPFMAMTRMAPIDRSLFRWRAPDGSEVLTWHSIKGYGWGVGLGLHRDLDDARLKRIAEEIGTVQVTTRGPLYLSWGTDLWSPNTKLIENVSILNQRLSPTRFRLASPEEYFRAASQTKDIPALSGEIPSSWANVISSLSHLWPPVMAATDVLLNAEKFAAINYALGYAEYPDKDFEALWKKALEAMDHNNYGQGGDIGDERKLGHAQAVSLLAGQILRNSLRNIAERVRHPFPKSTPIVVFNPLGWIRSDPVRTHVTLYGDVAPSDIADYKKAMRLVDEKNRAIPFQVEQYSENISRAVELIFIAQDVPPLGYKTYYLVPAGEPETFPDACRLKLDTDNDLKQPRRVIGAHQLENGFYRISVDRATGRIDVFDKDLDRMIARNLEITAAEERGGNTISIEPQTGRTIVFMIQELVLEESNPVRAVVRITGDVAGIPLVQRLLLYRGLKRIDLENIVDWKPGRFMKIEQLFPLEPGQLEIRNGIPFGSAATADIMPGSGPHFGDEVSKEVWKGWRQIQDWVFAGNQDWGITISADHQLLTVTDSAIRAGMLRGTRFNPLNIVRDEKIVLLQQPPAGRYIYRYSLTSSKGNWVAGRSWRAGMSFSTPLIPVSALNELSAKTLPAERSFCSLEGDSLVISALKKADRDPALVLRFFNMGGEVVRSSLRFLEQNPAIRTINLLEEEPGNKDQTTIQVKPYEIGTIKLQMQPLNRR